MDYPNYEASTNGEVRNKKTGRVLKGTVQADGYVRITIRNEQGRRNMRVHRLVLQTFNPVENCQDLEVNHINGIRADNSLSNLEWATKEENIALVGKNRQEINNIVNGLVVKYGYDETTILLKKLLE